MIRSQFHIDPWSLSDDKFAALLSEALWLKKFEAEQMENSVLSALAKAFSKQQTN